WWGRRGSAAPAGPLRAGPAGRGRWCAPSTRAGAKTSGSKFLRREGD
ncbi:MAG: hypothetical protein AVDCRST_MAG22-2427, partial [uncultured Rubrobacteraceae bacterium]